NDGIMSLKVIKENNEIIDFEWLFINVNAVKLFKMEIDDYVGTQLLTKLPEFKETGLFDKFIEAIETNETLNFEFNFNNDKINIWIQVIIVNSIDGLVVTFRDITQRILSEEELRKTKQEAIYANKMKSEFLANMSHEIRTPLNAILGYADILMEDEIEDSKREKLEIISKNGNILLSLINDILDLSKIEANKLSIVYDYINLKTLIGEIFHIFQHKISEKKIQLINKSQDNLPKVYLDETRCKQVLLNLVGNAIKFTHEGGITVETSFKIIDDSLLNLSIKIIDTGIGIREEEKEKIFDSFIQQSDQDSQKYGGTGLGLTITKRLVEIMGGRIELESALNKGSVFSVIFENLKYKFQNKNEILEINYNQNEKIDFLKSNLLVVDDISINRKIIKNFLKPFNLINLKEAESGKDALNVIENFHPDLIITDLKMAEINGYELAEILKKDSKYNKIPIIVYTATVHDPNLDIFDGKIYKPINKIDLINTIKKYLPYKVITVLER
ncbi:MAG: response regulator, partial [Leptospiraceae bacterium]|nr:response regulator [Leptospiraceae bacterium]